MISPSHTQIILVSTYVLLLYSCQSNDRVQREGEPTIYTASASDTEMIIAGKKARATLPKFLAVLQNHDSMANNFAIKYPFDAENGKEYIWLGEPTLENGKWYGTVDNTPEYTKQVRLGQKISWDTSRVADWNYTSHDTLKGGYSIRLLRSRMSKRERVEFDKSTNWIIQ